MKTDKKYTALEAATELKKSLHKAIAKADPALKAILADLGDDNSHADVDKDQVPSAVPQNVLYKAPQQPQIKAPSLSNAGPKIGAGPKNSVPANITQMAINSAPKAPAAPKAKLGLSLPKSESMSESHSNLNGMGKLKHFVEQRKLKKASQEKGVHTSNHEGPGRSAAGSFISAAKQGNTSIDSKKLTDWSKEEHKEKLADLKSMPKPALTKSEYSPREVAIAVLEKAEAMLKAKKEDWDTQEVKKNTLVDPSLTEERQVVNENDINNEARQQEVDTSKERLNKFLVKRKAKKVKEQ